MEIRIASRYISSVTVGCSPQEFFSVGRGKTKQAVAKWKSEELDHI